MTEGLGGHVGTQGWGAGQRVTGVKCGIGSLYKARESGGRQNSVYCFLLLGSGREAGVPQSSSSSTAL